MKREAGIGEVTDQLFKVILPYLDADPRLVETGGTVQVATTEAKMQVALNALGNVVAGLLCACPDPDDKMEWFCVNMIDSCKYALKKRDDKVILQ